LALAIRKVSFLYFLSFIKRKTKRRQGDKRRGKRRVKKTGGKSGISCPYFKSPHRGKPK